MATEQLNFEIVLKRRVYLEEAVLCVLFQYLEQKGYIQFLQDTTAVSSQYY